MPSFRDGENVINLNPRFDPFILSYVISTGDLSITEQSILDSLIVQKQ
ncbi:MAG: hypothetical protein RLZZ262_2172 [Bacteroidota bacterium]|jgi:hypothetical protein